MDLNVLWVFEAVHETRSFPLAAKRLGLSQPGLSRAVARLRTELEDPLFVKVGGELMLTPRAEIVAEHVAASVERLRQAWSNQQTFVPASASRLFTIVMGEYCEPLLLPRICRELEAQAPGVRLESLDPRHASEVGHREVDLSIGSRGLGRAGFRVRRLLRDRFVCLLRRNHAALDNGELRVEDYVRLRHLVVTGQAPADGRAAVECSAPIIAVQSALAAAELVALSGKVAILPSRIARRFSELYDLTCVAPPVELGELELFLSWHERVHEDAGHRWLRQLLVDAAAALYSDARLPLRPARTLPRAS